MNINSLLSMVSRTWLIGALFKADKKTHLSALYEFVYLILWSVLPFALAALVLYVTSEPSMEKSFFELGKNTFRNGELLVFTISMLAPILYLTLHDPELAQPFPHKLPISTIVALIIVTCASLFALLKATSVKDIPFVYNFSIALTIAALLFRYLAIVYHKIRMPPLTEKDLRAPQEAFVEDYRRHIEGNVVTADDLKQHLEAQA